MLHILYPLLLINVLALPTGVYASDWAKKSQITSILDQKMRRDGVPGLSIAIVRDGQLWWSLGLGLADIEQGVAASAETLYRAGSLVKPLTATAVLQLVEEDRLDADLPAWEYCTVFSKKTELVTSRRLLSHTSGVRTYKMPWSEYEKELFSKKRYRSVTDAISIFGDDALENPPGTRYHYTSYGFNLLGCVIESIADTTFMEFLDKRVLKPSGMHNTIVDQAEEIVAGRASHYRRDRKGRLIHEQYVDMSNKIPSGGLLSSVKDMARFAQSYMAGKLLSVETMQYAHTATTLNDGARVSYGAGWELPAQENHGASEEIFHSGLTPGATSIIYLYPAKQDAIVIMTNIYGMENRVKLIKRISAILHS